VQHRFNSQKVKRKMKNRIETIFGLFNLHKIFLYLFSLLFFLPLISVAQQNVITFSEIMYNPAGDDFYTEYIEIYNLSDTPIDLTGWTIRDNAESDILIASPSSDNMIIQPRSYALIIDSGYFTDGEGVYDSQIPDGTLLLTIEDTSIGSGLQNSEGETVNLLDSIMNTRSTRRYLPNAPQGVSEEKIDLNGDRYDSNWEFGTAGGTPGYAKIPTIVPPETYGNYATISPNPFSPNGDGYEDETLFRFSFPSSGVAITIRLFDSGGASLGKLLDNRVFEGKSEWRWNGRAGDDNTVLDAGIYVYMIRAQEVGGKRHWDLKGTVVTTGQ
jgi:Lamin Tail Domain